MTVWVARAGKYGERENQALKQGRAFIGWGEIGDLSSVDSREETQERLERQHPDDSIGKLQTNAGQIFNFTKTMQVGDIFALPLKKRPIIAFGKVSGEYEFLADNSDDAKHSRKIKWVSDIPRADIDPDLLYSFGSALTVFRVKRNNAEERINQMIFGTKSDGSTQISDSELINSEEPEQLDIEQLARQQISDFIGRRFKGHKMEKLVADILRAQGFTVRENKKVGADGGADILAGRGPMGFNEPLLCVQVKSTDAAIGSKEYSELKGVMQDFKAEHGLFVSWGGFKPKVEENARRDFFKIRLWNAEDLVGEIQDVYSSLPKELQADLPMQQVWTLVDDG